MVDYWDTLLSVCRDICPTTLVIVRGIDFVVLVLTEWWSCRLSQLWLDHTIVASVSVRGVNSLLPDIGRVGQILAVTLYKRFQIRSWKEIHVFTYSFALTRAPWNTAVGSRIETFNHAFKGLSLLLARSCGCRLETFVHLTDFFVWFCLVRKWGSRCLQILIVYLSL